MSSDVVFASEEALHVDSKLTSTYQEQEQFFMTEGHMLCVVVMAATILVLHVVLSFTAAKLSRLTASRFTRSPRISATPPPLATLSSSLTNSPSPYAGNSSSPFSKSRLVLSTRQSPNTDPNTTPRASHPLSTYIPMLTGISHRTDSPAAEIPAQTPSMWTVSKRDVLRRRMGLPTAAAAAAVAVGEKTEQSAPPASATPHGSPLGRRLLRRFNASWCGRSQQPPPHQHETPAAEVKDVNDDWTRQQPAQGWPSELLAQTRCNTYRISSVQGLEASHAYKEWRTSGNVQDKDQVNHRLTTYQALRRADPDFFRSLLSRPILEDSTLLPVPRMVLVLEYVVTLLATVLVLVVAAAPALHLDRLMRDCPAAASVVDAVQQLPAEVRLLPLMGWLVAQLLSWSRGHTSYLGMMFGIYCVYEDTQYPEHLHVASTAQIMLCSAVEAAFVGVTLLLVGPIYSLVCMLLPPDARMRRTFGQSSLGMHSVVELQRSVRAVSQFLPASPVAARALGRAASLRLRGRGDSPNPTPLREAEMTPYAAAAAAAAASKYAVGSGGTSVYSWGAMFCRKSGGTAATAAETCGDEDGGGGGVSGDGLARGGGGLARLFGTGAVGDTPGGSVW